MPETTAQHEYEQFLNWCRCRSDALSRKAVEIAENLDESNRTGHLCRATWLRCTSCGTIRGS